MVQGKGCLGLAPPSCLAPPTWPLPLVLSLLRSYPSLPSGHALSVTSGSPSLPCECIAATFHLYRPLLPVPSRALLSAWSPPCLPPPQVLSEPGLHHVSLTVWPACSQDSAVSVPQRGIADAHGCSWLLYGCQGADLRSSHLGLGLNSWACVRLFVCFVLTAGTKLQICLLFFL